MGLLQNGFRDVVGIFKIHGAGALNGAVPQELVGNTHLTGRGRNLTAGEGITSEQVGIPLGYGFGVAWQLPQKPGMLSARMFDISVNASAAGLMGLPSGGTASLEITATNSEILPLDDTAPARTATASIEFTADALGELVMSGGGSASVEIIVSGADIVGILWGTGNADITISVSDTDIEAIADAIGTATVLISGSLVPYAIGHMTGSTTQTGGELTAPQVAAEVVNALLGTTIPVDTKKIAGVTVGGTGTELDPWGPA